MIYIINLFYYSNDEGSMQNEALYSKKSFLVSTGRWGCMGGGKGARGPSNDAVCGASNILWGFFMELG